MLKILKHITLVCISMVLMTLIGCSVDVTGIELDLLDLYQEFFNREEGTITSVYIGKFEDNPYMKNGSVSLECKYKKNENIVEYELKSTSQWGEEEPFYVRCIGETDYDNNTSKIHTVYTDSESVDITFVDVYFVFNMFYRLIEEYNINDINDIGDKKITYDTKGNCKIIEINLSQEMMDIINENEYNIDEDYSTFKYVKKSIYKFYIDKNELYKCEYDVLYDTIIHESEFEIEYYRSSTYSS